MDRGNQVEAEHETYAAWFLPQVAEINISQSMDVTGELLLYYGRINLDYFTENLPDSILAAPQLAAIFCKSVALNTC
jgi:hypothetical protein